MLLDRLRRLLPGCWLGMLGTIAGIATPAAFALLPTADAGRVAGRMLAFEAATSIAFGAALLLLENHAASIAAAERRTGSRFGAGMVLVAGALACTIAGYYGLQPMIADARRGEGPFSFGQLHAASAALFVVKILLVTALVWRASAFVDRRRG